MLENVDQLGRIRTPLSQLIKSIAEVINQSGTHPSARGMM
jgi:hypothetical protein